MVRLIQDCREYHLEGYSSDQDQQGFLGFADYLILHCQLKDG